LFDGTLGNWKTDPVELELKDKNEKPYHARPYPVPYIIQRKGKNDLICKCVTMIDPATGWFEIHQYNDKRSITVSNIAEQEWFSRYPWPTQITYDRGNEFIGKDFQSMIKNDY
jgi:hypothetical protein